MVFPVDMYGWESWAIKNTEPWRKWCFWILVLEKTLESLLDSKEIKPVHPKGNQPWIFIGRTDAEAEIPILWPLDVKSWLTGKDPDVGKDWRRRRRGWQRMRWLDGIIDSLIWVWAESRREWMIGEPRMLQSMWSQRVGHNLATVQQQQRNQLLVRTGAVCTKFLIAFKAAWYAANKYRRWCPSNI